ncbi:hypothetical protein LCL89_10160 [Halobacillus yeomjeoni]|uniref:hypothetical protein n=1 Tax=Halobacillus yeomjeoni TaxID=311194 RepID=UPI001CD3E47D|nr:hypothetical protein [Halobacillus yeomjeoni]MCA0984409.1 hypothetical protein [Halobacillus yeomjeoni]
MKKDKNTFIQTRWSNRQSSSRAPSAKAGRNDSASFTMPSSIHQEHIENIDRAEKKRVYTPERSREGGGSIVIPPAPDQTNHFYDSSHKYREEMIDGAGRKDDQYIKKDTLFGEILSLFEDPSSDRSIYDRGLENLGRNRESSSSYIEEDGESPGFTAGYGGGSDDFGFLADIASSFESTSSIKYDGIKSFYSVQGKEYVAGTEGEVDDSETIYEEISSMLEESPSASPDSYGDPSPSSDAFEERYEKPSTESGEVDYYEESSSIIEESSAFYDESSHSVDSSPEFYEESSSFVEETIDSFEEYQESSSDRCNADTVSSHKFPELLEEIMCSSESSSYEAASSDDPCCPSNEHCDEDDSYEECCEEKETSIIKVPVLLARLQVEIDIIESLSMEGLCELSKIEWEVLSVHAKTAAPSSKVFISGIFQVDIEYVSKHGKGSVHTKKFPVYWEKVVNVNWKTLPDFPKSHHNEYIFKESEGFHLEQFQKYSHPITSDLKSSELVWNGSVEEKDSSVHLQGCAGLCIDLLQEQYIRCLE